MDNYKYLLEVGKRIRGIRMEKRITIQEIHLRTGFARSCIRDIETKGKNAYLLTLIKIAEVLRVDVKEFL